METVFKLTQPTPEINVYENNQLIQLYRIDTLTTNSNLAGQFLHSSIRILDNSAVMIDGVISKSDKTFPKWTDEVYEAVRLQPFFLSNANDKNAQLIGKGLFGRGLHFNGTVDTNNSKVYLRLRQLQTILFAATLSFRFCRSPVFLFK